MENNCGAASSPSTAASRTVTTPPQPRRRCAGSRPPQGDPVVDRAFALLAAFDAGHRSLTPGRAEPAQRHPDQLDAAAGGPADGLGRAGAGCRRPLHVGLRLWEVASLAPRGQGLRAGGPAVHARPGGGHPPARAAGGARRRRRAAGRAAVGAPGDARALPGRRAAARCTRPGSAWCCWPSPSRSSRRRCSPSRWCTSRRRSRSPPPRCAARWPRSAGRALATIRRRVPQPLVTRGRADLRRRRPGRRRAVGRRPAGERRARGCSARRSGRRPARSPVASAPGASIGRRRSPAVA